MKPYLISIYRKEFYHPDVVKKLTLEANVKFGPFNRDHFLKELSEVKGIILNGDIRLNEEILHAAPRLEVVSMFGVGYDIVDVEACTRHHVYVTITPVLSDAVADLTFMLILGISRSIVKADCYARVDWSKTNQWPFLPLGRDLSNKTLGIIGLGRIGFEVAKRAIPFGMKIVYTDIIRKKKVEKFLKATYLPLKELLRKADYITIHTPLTTETRGLISEDQLKLMKKSAYLINTSRGAIINQNALTKALQQNRIAGAGLDVFAVQPIPKEDPLLKLDNVILSPLMGSATIETFKRIGMTAIDNIFRVLHGTPPKNLIPEQYGKIFEKKV